MLVKNFTDGSDYHKALRQRRLAALAMLALGLIGLACALLLVPESNLSDHAKGFYTGGATGLILGALVLLVRIQLLIKNPEAQQKAKIKEKDERNQQIVNQSAQVAGVVTVFTMAASLFVLIPLNFTAYVTVICVILFYSIVFLVANLWLTYRK